MSDAGPVSGTSDGWNLARNLAGRAWTQSNSSAASTVGSVMAKLAAILFSGGWSSAGASCGAGPGVRVDSA
jgi:hypothetical protein